MLERVVWIETVFFVEVEMIAHEVKQLFFSMLFWRFFEAEWILEYAAPNHNSVSAELDKFLRFGSGFYIAINNEFRIWRELVFECDNFRD